MRRRGQIRIEEALTATMEEDRYCTHFAYDEQQRPGPGLRCCCPQSMGQSWGPRNGAMPSFCGMDWIPPDLPKYCDGCQAKFSISHTID